MNTIATKVVIRPYLFEVGVVFLAGYFVGKYANLNIPTIAEVKEIVATTPEVDVEMLTKRKPWVQYGNGQLVFNLGRRGK